jgi:hypothetical protein
MQSHPETPLLIKKKMPDRAEKYTSNFDIARSYFQLAVKQIKFLQNIK